MIAGRIRIPTWTFVRVHMYCMFGDVTLSSASNTHAAHKQAWVHQPHSQYADTRAHARCTLTRIFCFSTGTPERVNSWALNTSSSSVGSSSTSLNTFFSPLLFHFTVTVWSIIEIVRIYAWFMQVFMHCTHVLSPLCGWTHVNRIAVEVEDESSI